MLPASRNRLSSLCALVGVGLLMLAWALPDAWHPTVPLFIGLALLAVSHILTPCQDQITRWWRERISR